MAFTVEMLMVCVLLKSINFCYLLKFMLTTYLLLLFQLTKRSTTNIKLVFPVLQKYPNLGIKLQKTLRFQFKMSEEREWGGGVYSEVNFLFPDCPTKTCVSNLFGYNIWKNQHLFRGVCLQCCCPKQTELGLNQRGVFGRIVSMRHFKQCSQPGLLRFLTRSFRRFSNS